MDYMAVCIANNAHLMVALGFTPRRLKVISFKHNLMSNFPFGSFIGVIIA